MATIEKLKKRLLGGSRLNLSEVRRLLGHLGYELARHKGSHEQWVKEGRTFTLPCHPGDVPHYILDALQNLMERSDG
jgi:predicted RNA binding protein YcfA (HicA-like mRNA interferase family)